MISALVSAGIDGGYLVNSRLAKVHWQAGDRPLPAPRVSVAGESALWVDPAEIPADADVARARPGTGRRAARRPYELMANTAAYSGLRWGELAALTIGQVDQDARVITVDRKVVEVGGHLYVEAPKNRKLPQDDLPGAHPVRLPAGRKAGRAHRGGPRRAGGRD